MPLSDCRIISLPKITDPKGNLTFVDSSKEVPFEIQRVYYLYDVPGGSDRGSHAHKKLHQLIIAISGSFDITLKDGTGSEKFHLSRPYLGLYVAPMTWRYLDNFSSGAVCLVLASTHYDEEDYIRDYQDFLNHFKSTG